jgi:hypothetical protein
MHFPLIVLLLVLTVVVIKRWPASYGALAAVTMVLALSGQHLSSIERYGFAAFPVVIALGQLCERKNLWHAVLTVSTAAMGAFALLAFLGIYIP